MSSRVSWRSCLPAVLTFLLLAWWGAQSFSGDGAAPPLRHWTFSLQGAKSVTVESFHALEAHVIAEGSEPSISISARPRLMANHYHGREPEGREKPPEQVSFTWSLQREPETLEARALGETLAPDHRYYLDELQIHVPAGVTVQQKKQPLDPLTDFH